MVKAAFLCLLLTGCSVMTPRTIALEAGSGIRHEPGEPAVQTNTVAVKILWEIRK